MALVDLQVSASLRWLARSQPVHDHGIDMHVEPLENGDATGQLLALQIKGGPSYFRSRAPGGWWHRVDAKHASYWIGHALPVVVVLVNVRESVAYWSEVRPDTLLPVGRGFKLLVPADQQVAGAASAWARILGERGRVAAERFEVNLERLPPSVVFHLQTAYSRDPDRAALLADALNQAGEPRRAAEDLLQRMEWLRGAGAPALLALANFAAEHDLHQAQSTALLAAAEALPERAAEIVAQAALAAGDDRSQAESLLARARSLADDSRVILADVAEAHLYPARVAEAGPEVDVGLVQRLGDAKDDPIVLQYRGASALRARRFDDAATALRRYLELQPNDTARMIDLAHALSVRGSSHAPDPGDLDDAIRWADAARQERARWNGSTIDALSIGVRALGLQQRLSEALERTLPPPRGTASQVEAADPEIARLGAATARQLGRSQEEVAGILNAVADPRLRADLLEEFDADAEEDDRRRIDVLERLVSDTDAIRDPVMLVQRVYGLAALGVDRSAAIARLPEGLAPANTAALVRAIAAHQHEPDEIEPSLREFALTDALAAETLVNAYDRAGRTQRAAATARAAAERFGQQRFIELQVHLAVRADDRAQARSLLQDALTAGRLRGRLVPAFQTLLAEILANDGEYRRALELFETAAAARDAPPTAAWNAVRCAALLEEWFRARRTIDAHRLEPSTLDEARVWHNTMLLTGWTEATAELALELVQRYADDAEFTGAALGSIVQFTRTVDPNASAAADRRPLVGGELHARAFELLRRLRPESVVQVDIEDDLSALRGAARARRSRETQQMLRAAANGTYPVGTMGLVLGGAYGLLLARRPFGIRFASSIDADLHERENQDALAAVDGPVVVDTSTLELLPDLGEPTTLLAAFSSVTIAATARRDLVQSEVEARAETASVGRLTWEEGSDKPILVEADPTEQLRVLGRTEEMNRVARSCLTAAVGRPYRVLPQKADGAKPLPWLDGVELAAQLGVPLWADDAALRQLAREHGVPAFGSVNLIEARRLAAAAHRPNEAERTADEQAAFVHELRRLGIGEQPITEDELVEDIRQSAGSISMTSSVLGRAAWWHHHPQLRSWLRICETIRSTGSPLEPWIRLVVNGVIARTDDQTSGGRLSLLLALSAGGVPLTAASARPGLIVWRERQESLHDGSLQKMFASVIAALANGGLVDGDASALIDDLLEMLDGTNHVEARGAAGK